MTQLEIEKAVKLLRGGGLVAFPTETVYGLGADAKNYDAVQKVFRVKGRPQNHPLIVHLASSRELKDWARTVPHQALLLAQAFWPGPLTLILKKKPQVHHLVTGNQDTIALRIPSHPIAQALLQAFGGGLVGPSANLFTQVSPTNMQAVHDEIGDKIDLILDGGECEVGLESTIIDMSRVDDGQSPVILRPGMISAREIENVIETKVDSKPTTNETIKIHAPGMHSVHYAPKTKVLLVERKNMNKAVSQLLKSANQEIAILALSDKCYESSAKIHIIDMPRLAKDYAKRLYQTLRKIDNQKRYQCIVIEMVPNDETWIAIRDRLLKASAKK